MEFNIGQKVKIIKYITVDFEDGDSFNLYDDMIGKIYIVSNVSIFPNYIEVHDFNYKYYVPVSILEIVEE